MTYYVYAGSGPQIVTGKVPVASQFGLTIYNSGVDLIGHAVSIGPSVQLPGMETFYSQTRTITVIELPKAREYLIFEIRYRKQVINFGTDYYIMFWLNSRNSDVQ